VSELRVKALREFIQPKTKKQLKSFLGMVGYYRRFVPGFSSIAKPLTEATKRLAPNRLRWTDHMHESFHNLKDTPCRNTELTIPSSEDNFLLSADASGDGIGAVLSVQREDHTLPVAYRA